MIKKTLRNLLSVINRNLNRLILIGHGVKFGRNVIINGSIYIRNHGRIEIGDNVVINSGHRFNPVGGQTFTRIIVRPGAELRIGNDAGISNSTIVVQSRVDISPGVMIGGSCNIWDTDFHSMDAGVRGGPKDCGKTYPIYIGDKAFVGAHSILLKGTWIGSRAIVGAGSVGSLRVHNDKVFIRR